MLAVALKQFELRSVIASGGMGTVFGPLVGAFTVVTLQNYLAGFGSWVTVIMGGIFVVCVLAFRRGIVGEWLALFKK